MKAKEIVKELLRIQAIHLSPENPFTWTSGIKSPIYCDNRQIISHVVTRKLVIDCFVDKLKESHPDVEVIAGTATAGIPHAAWIADRMKLPMIYVRGSSKGHGLQNKIEGKLTSGSKVVIIEDLISTGKSAIEATLAVQAAGGEVLEVVSIFSYGLQKAFDSFRQNNIKFSSLTNVEHLLQVAQEQELINNKGREIINKFVNSN